MDSATLDLVKCDTLFARIRESLSSYDNSGLIDEGKFYAEVKWFIDQFGIPVYEKTEAMLHLCDHKGELPCDFFLLDSAWLCHREHKGQSSDPSWIFQNKSVIYSEISCEKIAQNNSCGTANPNLSGVVIESCPATCNNEITLEKVTVKQYVRGGDTNEWNFHRPTLLKLNNQKSIRKNCTQNCPNLHCQSHDEISILSQGDSKYMYSNIKNPMIHIIYYKYPIDLETGLPLIPENPTMQKALEYHLMYTFFYTMWLNGDDVNLENKVKSLRQDRDNYMGEARCYSLTPSFNKMIATGRRVRKRFSSYEVMNTAHM